MESRPRRDGTSPLLMQYWGNYIALTHVARVAMQSNVPPGYKFETLCTLPRPWGETPRDYIENRDNEIVNNKEQYCSVVRTGFGKTIVCLGGEVDASKLCTPPPIQPHAIAREAA